VEPVRDADLLVIEATYATLEADVAREFGHLTAGQAAQLAVDAGVRNLILHHISRRYTEREIRAEAEPIFPGAIVARDMDHYQVRREAPLVKVDRDKRTATRQVNPHPPG
jgi:ribonuclease Z